jgi:chromosome segregation ATPase
LEERSGELQDRTRYLANENDRSQKAHLDASHDNQFLKNRIVELERLHEEETAKLKDRLDYDKRATVEQEKSDLNKIHTAERGQLELEIKSNHKRIEELHSKLSLVVAENERLQNLNRDANKEIESLNMRAQQTRDANDDEKRRLEELRHHQLTSQSKDLTGQLNHQRAQYEERIAALRNEIMELEKLKDVIKERDQEIDNLKVQNRINERNWEQRMSDALASENHNLNSRFALERRDLQSEIANQKDRINELEHQLALMTAEVERLAQLHDEKDNENDGLKKTMILNERDAFSNLDDTRARLLAEKRDELAALENNLQRAHDHQMRIMTEKNSDLEDKVMNLIEENQKVSDLAEERQKESEYLKYKLDQEGIKNSQMMGDAEKRSSQHLKMTVERELNSCMAKNSVELANYENRMADLNKEIANLESKCNWYEGEISRLNNIINNKNNDVDVHKRSIASLETQRQHELDHANRNFEALKNANIDVTTHQIKWDAEKGTLNSKIVQLQERIEELEKRLALLVSENDKLRNLFNEKSDELDNTRRRLNDAEDRFDLDRNNYEAEIDRLQHANLDIKELSLKFSAEKAQYENQIRQLKTLSDNNKEELEKVYDLMGQRKKDQDELSRQNEEYRRSIEKLNSGGRVKDTDITQKQERIDALVRRIEELETERDIYVAKSDKLDTEITKINNEIEAKVRDLDTLKRKYEKSLEISNSLNSQLMTKLMKNE